MRAMCLCVALACLVVINGCTPVVPLLLPTGTPYQPLRTDSPLDSLGEFTLGQTWEELHGRFPDLKAAPYLDKADAGTKAFVIRDTTLFNLPVRSVSLHFLDTKLVRVFAALKDGVAEAQLLRALGTVYGEQQPNDAHLYIWRGKEGTVRMTAAGSIWVVLLHSSSALDPPILFVRPSAARPSRRLNAPMDSLGPFILGQSWEELEVQHPALQPAPELDKPGAGTQAALIRDTTLLGMPMRSVALHFLDGKLVRVFALIKSEVIEEQAVRTVASHYGNPGPKRAGAYVWEGQVAYVSMRFIGQSQFIELRPGSPPF